ncbi:MAG: hypothetical protein H0U59_00560 [Gemmatimonadaceae bacterium]|nr:hypothetical protein [Gemmatimonadaceae bacterium]
MLTVFILDDEEERHLSLARRYPGATVTHAYKAAEAKALLAQGPYDLMFLDHNLGDWSLIDGEFKEQTGLDIVRYLIDNIPREKWPGSVTVHSLNGSHGPTMVSMLQKAGITAAYVPFRG